MVTIFALPKPFRGHINVIQRNAITSWTRLSPRPEIILFGNDEGTAAIAQELGLRHIPEVKCTEHGAPLVSDLFETAQKLATYPTLCYINADILLLSDFTKAAEQVTAWRDRFLLAGRRTYLDVLEPLDFTSPDYETRLRHWALEKGLLGPASGVDYFLFSKGLYLDLLPLALGRMYWDSWLVWRARSRKAPVVDASAVLLAIHQNHDFSHIPNGITGILAGGDALNNLKLIRKSRLYTLDDATYKLGPEGFQWNAGHLLSPIKRALKRWWFAMVQATAPVRHRLGIRGPKLARFSNFLMGINVRLFKENRS